ncbi:hypothetical protein [uncultured Bacteroides sp.]|uniref:OmpA family protein n=1 Tax=uncultured Bacteroides sp. TaxID=162156 RepID=UPI002AA696DD|nr:hypothetical protein [uncultured Bacteroides sp.]
MKCIKISFIIIIAAFISFINVKAGNINTDSLSIRYKIDEEWYVQAQGGINYMAAENTRFVNFWEVLSPQVSLSLGKYFTPVWGARLQFVMGKNKGVYYAHDANSPLYSFSHYGILGIGSFNITNFLNRNKSSYNPKSWNISTLLGLGTLYTSFGFDKNISRANVIDLDNETYLSAFAGVEATRKISRNWEVNLELSSNWMDNKYNGQTSIGSSKLNFDGMINLLVGVRYIFNRAKRIEKTSTVTHRREGPFIPSMQQSEPEIQQSIVSDKVKHDTIRQTVTYYSVEELLEMTDNHKSIRGKQFAKTESINFDYGKYTIKPFNSIYLDKIAELMKKTNIVLLIRGFAVKESVLDDQLMGKRINAVRDYLLKNRIKRDRLVYQSIKSAELSLEDKDKGQTVELEILPL